MNAVCERPPGTVIEDLFENRFMHVAGMNRIGSQIPG